MSSRDPRSDKGKPRGKRPNKYKIREIEPRGAYAKEARIFKLFWQEHSMSDIEILSPEELDKVIEAFFQRFQERQIKINPRWWYPDSPKDRIVDLRYRK